MIEIRKTNIDKQSTIVPSEAADEQMPVSDRDLSWVNGENYSIYKSEKYKGTIVTEEDFIEETTDTRNGE